jgi:hypothetical protein
VGVIAYELLVGRRPYVGKDRKEIREQMLAKEAKIPEGYAGRISKDGADFINKVRVGRRSCCRGWLGSGWAITVYRRY